MIILKRFVLVYCVRQIFGICSNQACESCSDTDLDTLHCMSCNAASHRTMNVFDCPCDSGYYDDGGTCLACHTTCLTCRNADYDGCYTCKTENFRSLQNNDGNISCSCKWFQTNNGPQCGAINGTACATCADTLNKNYPNCDDNTIAISDGNYCGCIAGYYDNGGELCHACGYTCSTCTAASAPYCLSCSMAMKRMMDANSKNCPCKQGYYDNGKPVCLSCRHYCLTCEDNLGCLSCPNSSSFRNQTTNNCRCLQGYFDNNVVICAPCHHSCYNCLTALITGCTSCPPQNKTLRVFNPFLSTCACRSGYFDNGVAICEPCNYTCQSCTSAIRCSSCNVTNFRTLHQTACQCQQGYFDSGRTICDACHYQCLTCTNVTNKDCSSCNSKNFRFLSESSCRCRQGYFDGGIVATCVGICIQYLEVCHDSCSTCSNASSRSCLTCNLTNFRKLQKNECLCERGYFENKGAICIACHPTCQTCSNISETDCLSCDPEISRQFFANNSTCLCKFGYENNGSQSCTLVCDLTCQTCYDNSIQGCLSCDSTPPYQRSITVNHMCQCDHGYQGSTNGTCIPINCEANQFFDEFYQLCGSCDKTCQTCTGPSKQQCLSCDERFLRILQDNQCQCHEGYLDQIDKAKCTQSCQDGYQIGVQCFNCHPLCSLCTGGSPLDCIACQQSHYDELNSDQKNGQQYYQNSPINFRLDIRSYICQDSVSKEVQAAKQDTNISFLVTAKNKLTQKLDFSKIYHSFKVKILQQSLQSGQQYSMMVQVIKSKMITQEDNNSLSGNISISFNIDIISVAKVVIINGGNKVIGNSGNLNIECQIFDFNNQDTPIQDLTSYTFTWACNPITQDIQCVDRQGRVLDTSSLYQNLEISAQDLEPYNSYEFHVVVYDTIERNRYNNFVIYQVLDQSIPTMSINFDTNILALPVNLNLQQKFEFIYPLTKNPDDLFYSANLIYNFKIVSTIIYHYSTVNFRIWDYFEDFTNSSGIKLFFKGQVYNPQYIIPSSFSILMKVNLPPKMCEISVSPNEGVELVDQFLIQVSSCQDSSFIYTYRFAYYQSQRNQELDNKQQSFTRASMQTSFQDQNFLSTFLPTGDQGSHIVLLISVKDSLGGITNYTKKVKVTPLLIANETSLMEAINNISDSTSQLRYLQVISVSLLDSNQYFPIITSFMTQFIMKVNQFPLIEEQQNQVLKIQEFTSAQITNLDSLITLQQSTSQTLITQIKDAIINQKANPSNVLNQQEHDKLINLNIVLDSQHILGTSILQNLVQKQNSSLSKNSSQFESMNQKNLQVMKLLNETRQIQIEQMTPNAGTKLLVTQYATSAVALTTKKILSEMLGKNIIDDTQNDFLTEQIQVLTNDYYSFSYLQYTGNPYSSNPDFPYTDQGFSAIDLQITKQSKNQISSSDLVNSPNINISQSILLTIDQKNHQGVLNSQELDSDTRAKSSKVCVSKINYQKWSADECITILSKDKISCQCNTINPTTVIMDIDGFFTDKGNSAIFSTSSFDAINSFQWYKITLIWIIIAITIIYLISLYLGWKKDNFDRAEFAKLKYRRKKKNLIEIEIPQQNEFIKTNDINSIKEKNQLITGEAQNTNQVREQGIQDSPKQQNQPENNFLIENSPSLIEKTTNIHTVIVKATLIESDDVTFLLYFKTNHNFLNIYHSYEELNRPIRSSLLYLCLVSSLAATLYFGSSLTIGRTIVLTVMSSVATSIIMLSLKVLLTARLMIVNIIGIFFFLSLSGFCIFVILAVIATTTSISQTNVWCIQYSIEIIYDCTIGAFVTLVIKYKFFR